MKRGLLLLFLLSLNLFAKFEVITLGNSGGVKAGTTTSYILRDIGSKEYLALDAGSVVNGLEEALKKGNFKDIKVPEDSNYTKLGYIFRESIKGYFLSHAHMDHIAGLVLSSTEDTKKNIYGLPSVIDILEKNIFNWKVWPNFGDSGEGFKLGVYSYKKLEIGKEFKIEGTELYGQVFPLSHSNYESSMLLIRSGEEYFAFFGDTGPDKVEKSQLLNNIWKELGPKLKAGKLKGIIIEVSFPNSTEDKNLFGHLTAKWLMEEMKVLSEYSGGTEKLKNLNIIINHIKPNFLKNVDNEKTVKKEIEALNIYKIKFLYPKQRESMIF
ncbi:3',5'-cyclic-nucleotide phosphodiesterase [Leptotrichia sp. OH3620_COT-345]|uniref:MBL fold metallo-hydrolase n=1 Tax=Leptotrichia sp. OH3620_COT-345 TaxID=2491048 RepID=UPI000F64BED7|nr:3',5'-cyclic-nucleotide phosphodiesterase [Leptotrichia sp. OH3620_COT-345]RRD39665.1 3',5'-cyclic-nucleotide phosphodiesterase [Leptotrichia sp. OH3620_COT-345]